MTLFLDRGAEFEQLRGDGLIGSFENVDQGARKGFIMLGEESNSEPSGAGTTGSDDLEKRQTDVQFTWDNFIEIGFFGGI